LAWRESPENMKARLFMHKAAPSLMGRPKFYFFESRGAEKRPLHAIQRFSFARGVCLFSCEELFSFD